MLRDGFCSRSFVGHSRSFEANSDVGGGAALGVPFRFPLPLLFEIRFEMFSGISGRFLGGALLDDMFVAPYFGNERGWLF